MAECNGFTVRKLRGTHHSSVPLLIPNDLKYVTSKNELVKSTGVDRTNLELVPESLELLKSIKRPVAVLAVGGPCRTGKSYILSRVLGSPDAFALGHTFDPKTLGIWIATSVLDCDDFTVILMDAEGIDSVFSQARSDACILVMTVLLSSFFVYNSIGVPHHSDLKNMSYFANLASCIAIDSSEKDMNAFDYKSYFPDFLWLLRDVHLLPVGKNGSKVSPTEYLVSTVLRRGTTFNASESDEVGRAILTFFPTIECKTLPPPSDSTDVLRNIALRQESLNPVFNEQVEELIPHLLQRLRPKHISAASLVDGPILASMTEQYLKAVNAPNAVPCIVDSWNVAVELRCEEVIKELTLEYIQEVKTRIQEVGMPMEEDSPDDIGFASNPHTLLGIHRCVLLKKTKALLDQVGHLVNTFLETYTRESVVASLEHSTVVFEEEPEFKPINGKPIKAKKVTGGALLKYAQQNHSLSRSSCSKLFEELYQKTQEKMLNNQEYSFNELLDDLKLTQLEYFRKAVGPAKWEVYAEKREFIKSQEHSFKLLKGFQKQIYDVVQKNAAESARIAKLTDEMKKTQVQMRNNAELSQKQIEAMQKEHQKEMERLHTEEEERRAQEQRKFMDFEAAFMKDMAVMSQESSKELKEQHKKIEHLLATTMAQNKREMSVLNSSISKLTDEIGAMSTPSGPSWGDQLFQVGLKVLETGAISALGSRCSLM